VSTKNYFRWPIKTVKLQLSGREPRYQCLPPPAACNGTLFPSSPWGGASKHLSQKQFFFPQQYLHKKKYPVPRSRQKEAFVAEAEAHADRSDVYCRCMGRAGGKKGKAPPHELNFFLS
jgi:hypothetical protein